MSHTVVRFAPSPTGYLHVGNVRTALVNWLFAKKQDGQFILRLDDTDAERSTEEFVQVIQDDLRWLGLTFDHCYRQTERCQQHIKSLETLKQTGQLYPCYETAEELKLKRKQQLAQGKPPLYDRAALSLTPEQIEKFAQQGRKPHWRLQLTPGLIEWHDLIRGPLSFKADHLSDPILVREDGSPVYMLCSVVDDIDMGVTHILRGDDHIANTAIQIQLIEALGHDSKQMTYAHLPVLMDAAGKGLSKRLGSLSIRYFRQEGIEAMALTSLLAKIGTSESPEPTDSMQQLIDEFDLAHVTRSSPRFSPDELYQMNAKLLHSLPFASIQKRLHALGLADVDADFWQLIQSNLNRLEDVKEWVQICRGEITPLIQDTEYIGQAKDLLPPEPWTEETWKLWTTQIKEKTGRKGKQLFMPLREALTGISHGPEMKLLLPQIGYQKTSQRLAGKRA
ncbi:MAG: glutamate--tRNA ligase [Pseudomonadota bacterium]